MNPSATTVFFFRALLLGCLLLPSVLFAAGHEHDVVLDTEGLAAQLDERPAHSDSPLQIHLSALGLDLSLLLQPSNATQSIELPDALSLWQGHVAGFTDSWARVSIDNGIPEGSLFFNNQLYQLTPRSSNDTGTQQAGKQHLGTQHTGTQHPGAQHPGTSITTHWVLLEPAVSQQAASLQQQFLGEVDTIIFPPASTQTEPAIQTPAPSLFDRRALPGNNGVELPVTRAMRIGIVVDSRFNAIHGGRGLARALAIINEVDGLYQQQLGVAVLVENTRVYEDAEADPMRDLSGEVATMLQAFRDARLDDPGLPRNLSLVHLFTGHRDPENIIGLGWIGSICRLDGYDVSISTPFPFGALLAAHEIAHNMGALHDDDEKCLALNANSNDQIMWPKITGATKPGFSDCSMRYMRTALTASCNIDNIDMAIQLQSRPGNSSMERTVIVHIDNQDIARNAPGVRSRTTFAEGTLLSSPSAGCLVNGPELICNHGTVTSLGSTVSVVAMIADVSSQQATAILELDAISDVNALDNRASLQILQFDPQSGDAVFAISATQTGGSAGQPSDAIRLGLLSLAEWLLVAMAFAWRCYTRLKWYG